MTSVPPILTINKPAPAWTRRDTLIVGSALVLAVVALIVTIVTAVGSSSPTAKVGATMASMATIDSAIASFQQTSSRYPATLAALIPNHLARASKDGWKREFVYTVPGANGKPYDLISTGEDGLPGTADDISVWTMDQLLSP